MYCGFPTDEARFNHHVQKAHTHDLQKKGAIDGSSKFVTGIISFLIVLSFIIFLAVKDSHAPPFGIGALGKITTRSQDEIVNNVRMGMRQNQVTAALGEPDDKQEMNQAGIDFGEGIRTDGLEMDLWYYNCKGGMVQIGFLNGKVDSINSY